VLRNEDADEDNTHTILERDKSPDALSPTHDVKHINHDDPKWETVKSRRRNAANKNNQDTKNEKPTVLYGTAKAAPKSSTILGALRRKWLYVGRIIGNEVAENDVKDYLQNIDCHDEIIIKKLTTKGHNSAFSIGVPPKISNDVFNPDIWPDSVCLREFNVRSFFREETPYPKQHVSSTDETKVFNVPIQNITSIINILYINIQSVGSKILELESFLQSAYPIEILCLNEHWLSPNDIDVLSIDNYTVASSFCRSKYKHGGVAVLIHNSLKLWQSLNTVQYCEECIVK
jgi:hypothetical protein